MKAVKQYKEQWEEAQSLQLIELAEQTYLVLNFFYRKLKLILNLILFITYQVMKLVWNIARIAFFTQPINQVMRDEQWLFRHIK